MTEHLADETVVELASGDGGAAEREHTAACAACALRVREIEEALAPLRRADVPEPSPLYWEALRGSVRRRIAEDKKRHSLWTLLLPLAAAAALAATFWGGPARPPGAVTPSLPAWSPLPVVEEDAGLRVLEGLALLDRDADWDEPAGLAPYLAGLTDDESKSLAEELRGRGPEGES